MHIFSNLNFFLLLSFYISYQDRNFTNNEVGTIFYSYIFVLHATKYTMPLIATVVDLLSTKTEIIYVFHLLANEPVIQGPDLKYI